MESRILSTLILVCLSFTLKSAAAKCPLTWTAFNVSCYKFVAEKTTWYDAEEICETAKSHLININSKAEEDFAVQMAESHKTSVWIGLTDLMEEGRFLWDETQEVPSYTFWAPKQPDNWMGHEDCVQLVKHNKYLWNDIRCERKLSAICEKLAN